MVNQTKLLAEFEKTKTQKVFISLSEFEGHKYVDIRVHVPPDDTPTRKGITVPPAKLPLLIEKLQEAQAILERAK